MSASVLSDVLQLSVSERIQLVEDIWDTLAASSEDVPISQAQQDELDKRLEAHRQNPQLGSSWQQAKERIMSDA